MLLTLISSQAMSEKRIVNVYAWGGEIPKKVIQNFEHDTGIKVNFSTYDNNETMYAKVRASKTTIYDVILPSAYFVERMRKQDLLMRLDKRKLPHLKNISKQFINHPYDPNNQYSIPLIWGATGLFYNAHWITKKPLKWEDLWDSQWKNQLMMLDDPREVFAIALLRLGYSPNDVNPEHIQQAYQALLKLTSNIKLFASESIQAILIDEDAMLGTAWNGDVYKARQENKDIEFIYPEEGFVIWIDCLSMLKNAPHKAEAYAFIDYMLRSKTAADIALIEGHAITNQKGLLSLPDEIKNNPLVYPDEQTLKNAIVQGDIGEQAILLYHQYWQQIKLSF
ncbi:MAG: ABC transporter substrate-binding protein [Legionellaceae bacterium]